MTSELTQKLKPGDIVALGIDLGTTNSCICAYGANGRIDVIENVSGSSRSIPSVVSFINGEYRVGEEAQKTQLNAPKSTYNLAKRFIGKKVTDRSIQADVKSVSYDVILDYEDPITHEKDDRPRFAFNCKEYDIKEPLYPEEISAILLKYLYQIAQGRVDKKKINDVVITVPANFNDSQRRATIDAGTLAGFNVLKVITEPTAAAIAYAYNMKESIEKKLIMVFDFGGGTLDVSAVKIDNSNYTVLATDGDTDCGGTHINMKFYEKVKDGFLKKYGIDIESNVNQKVYIMQQIENAKKALSNSTLNYKIYIENRPEFVQITKENLKKICYDMKDQILKPIENVIKILEKKEISKDSIDSIVAVGGSSSIPFITDIVSELMGNKQVDKSLDPSEAIAIGASIYGSYLKRDTFPNLFKNEIKIVDVVPMAIGIGIKSNKVIHLVNKNQTRPYKSRSFNFVGQQGSNVVNIDVYEGDSEYQDQCNLVQSNTMEDPLKDENGRPTLSVCIDVTEETFRLTVESGDKVINKEFITKSGSHDEAEKTKMRKNIEELMTYHCQENEEIFEQTPATEFKSFISSIKGKREILQKRKINPLTYKKIISKYKEWADKNINASQEDVDSKMKELKEEIINLK